MYLSSPPIVIDHGSYTTRVGLACDDLPRYVVDSCYLKKGEVFNLLDDGLINNFDILSKVWNNCYNLMDLQSNNHPLVLTEETWNSVSNKKKLAQLAFEEFSVPLFSLLPTPLTSLYHMGRPSGLIIDIGSSTTSITSIIDGIIMNSHHSKFAGDFLNLHLLNYLDQKSSRNNLLPNDLLQNDLVSGFNGFGNTATVGNDGNGETTAVGKSATVGGDGESATVGGDGDFRVSEVDFAGVNSTRNSKGILSEVSGSEFGDVRLGNSSVERSSEATFGNGFDGDLRIEGNSSVSDSFASYYISRNILHEFKTLSLSYNLKTFQLPNRSHINVLDSRNYLENLFQPQLNKIPGINVPPASVDKPSTQGLTNLIFLALKNLEATLLPSGDNSSSSSHKFARFNEIFKTLFSNILITGGTSLAPGLAEQIIQDIRALTPKYFPNYGFNPYAITTISSTTVNDINDIWDRQFSGWLGAANLALMLNDKSEDSNSVNIALDNWFVTKADYEELGEDLIAEKFK